MPETDALTAAMTAAVATAHPESDTAKGLGDAPPVPVETADEPVADDPAPTLDETGAAIAAAAKPAEEPVVAKTAEEQAEDEFAAEHGLSPKEPSGRENRIPYSRVKKITENAVKKATTVLTGERDTLKGHNDQYVQRLTHIKNTEDIMLSDPDRFMQMLSTLPHVGERYKALLAGKAAPAAADLPDASADPEPEPDGENGGAPAYSPAQFKKLRAWERRQAIREAEARLTERYGPMETAYKTAREQAARQTASGEAINAHIAEASTWRHFSTFAKDIYEAMEADSVQAEKSGKFKFTGPYALRQAYEEVVFGRLHTDRQKQREELLAEMAKTPAGTTAGRTAAAPREVDDGTGDNVDKAMRKALRSAGLVK